MKTMISKIIQNKKVISFIIAIMGNLMMNKSKKKKNLNINKDFKK